MRIGSAIHGPRLVAKLMALSVALLVVPWLSWLLLVEMERALEAMQFRQQLLVAKGISTFLNGREDLFADLPIDPEDYEALYARPITGSARLDGAIEDWNDVDSHVANSFGARAGTADGSFDLSLGDRDGWLYAFVQVRDDVRVYRNPESLRLDGADHVRVDFIRADGEDGRIAITASQAGVTTAYRMDAEWRLAETGAPERSVQGHLVETDEGYALEFRLPLDMLGSRRVFGLSFVDVDDPQTRATRAVTRTLPTAGEESFGLVVYRSPEVLKIIEGLGYAGYRIMVIDTESRRRAETGGLDLGPRPPAETNWAAIPRGAFLKTRQWLEALTAGDADVAQDGEGAAEVIASALAGDPLALRRHAGEKEVIMAGHPIVGAGGAVIGLVAVEQTIEDIETFQYAAIDSIVWVSVASLIAFVLALIAFSGRLTWRIRNLRREAAAAIDEYGRLRSAALSREIHSGDEIGDLARSVSNMLTRLRQHNHFIENMPRTLRHEINNPLNVLSTSLQNLSEDVAEVKGSRYLESARRGVLRIGAIVENLADAASLEESLQAEDMDEVDLEQLLANYVGNCAITHPEHGFLFRGTGAAVIVLASDYRIEQMLDKIIDNAIDFHRAGSAIRVQLDAGPEHARIAIANRGPPLPRDATGSVFESMVSHRGPDNRLHFGLGLYVVRTIAEHHGGTVRALNLTDGSGVVISVQLPLAAAASRAEEKQAQEHSSRMA